MISVCRTHRQRSCSDESRDRTDWRRVCMERKEMKLLVQLKRHCLQESQLAALVNFAFLSVTCEF